MKKKSLLTTAFAISLLPMLFNQYGGARGLQEITGMINLLNPIGTISVLLFLAGVWIPFQKPIFHTVIGGLGVVGIVLSEMYQFFTWHVLTITGEISLKHSIRLAFPEFYIGLAFSLMMTAFYFIADKKIK